MGSACPSRRGPWTQGPPVVGRGTGWPAHVVVGLNQQRVVMYHVELLVAPHSPSHTQTLWHRLRLWRPDAANFRYFSPPLRRRRSSRDLCLSTHATRRSFVRSPLVPPLIKSPRALGAPCCDAAALVADCSPTYALACLQRWNGIRQPALDPCEWQLDVHGTTWLIGDRAEHAAGAGAICEAH